MFRAQIYLLLSLYIACATLISLKQTEEVINGVKKKVANYTIKYMGTPLDMNTSPPTNSTWKILLESSFIKEICQEWVKLVASSYVYPNLS